jgi:hypothetical protein
VPYNPLLLPEKGTRPHPNFLSLHIPSIPVDGGYRNCPHRVGSCGYNFHRPGKYIIHIQRCFAAIKNTHIFGTQKVGCYAASSLLELMEGKEWENFRQTGTYTTAHFGAEGAVGGLLMDEILL